MTDRSSSRRRYLWQAGWRRCIWCGGRLSRKSLSCEHYRPRAHGGTDRRDNLVAACHDCNQARGIEDWVPHPEVEEWAKRRGLMPA